MRRPIVLASILMVAFTLLSAGGMAAADEHANADRGCENVVAKWSRDNGSVGGHNPQAALCSDPANHVHHGDQHAQAGITGDLNGDCTVDLNDLSILLSAVGTLHGDPAWSHHADLNGDGVIDATDVLILQAHLGLTC